MKGEIKMKKLISVALAVFLVFSLAADCSSSPRDDWDFSSAPRVNLAYAVYLPETDSLAMGTIAFLETVKEYTQGTVDYTLYASQSLANADEQLDAVRSGLCDITFFATTYGHGRLPLIYMLDCPGTAYASTEALAYAVNEWFKVVDPPEIRDLKLLYATGVTGGAFTTTVPIRTFEDFAGKQMRSGAALLPVLQSYGSIPTAMVLSEVYEALRTGVIHGNYGVINAARSYSLYEVAKYLAKDPIYATTYQMYMNMDVWNSLSRDQQSAIETAVEDCFPIYMAPGMRKSNEESLELFVRHGVEIHEFSQEDIAKMTAASGSIQDDYAAGVEGGLEALAVLRELAAKYSAIYPYP